MNYSILMSVYKNEKVEYFIEALESVLNQTVKPSQIVLVRDGEVYEELQKTISDYISKYPDLFTYLPLEKNGGLGNALRYGLSYCQNELVARMDTDDISVEDRFEKQLDFFEKNPNVDIVGGNISEFINNPKDIVDYRIVPQTHEEISKYIKKRCPFNHVTVMFKKSALEKVNSYESFYLFEDYYLWVKMYLNNCQFANIDSVLVNVRISEMSKKRGGIKYYKSFKNLLKIMKKNKMIGLFAYIKTSFVRFCGYVLMPNCVREWAYKKFLRKKS